MATYIEMPKLSDTMTEGTLLKWRKNKGDKVESGDIIAEVETDKATMEMEAFDDGVLTEVYVNEGQKVAIGQRMALLLSPGEKAPVDDQKTESTPKSGGDEKPESAAPANKEQKIDAPVKEVKGAKPSSGSERVKASPLAKKVAAEKKVDLSQIEGTGPGGRIIQRDVLSGAPSSSKTAQTNSAAVPATPAGKGDQRIPLSGMRRAIAERLLASKTQIPHFYLNIEVDAAELMRLRSEINAASEKEGGGKLTINDFVLKAVVVALTRVPKVNAAFDRDAIIEYASVNLAVAVAIDDGLITPVIRDAQTKTLREISEGVKELATRARGKKLKPEEYQGGTFTVSNLGSYGIESFSAIINPPQAAILSVGAIIKKPVVNARNEVVAGQRMTVGLSCDHRVVDGAMGAQFLAELRRLLENPTLMLI